MSPHRYTGWEPATHTTTNADGSQYTTRDPEWDWIDRGIVNAWTRLTRNACTMCGRPWAVHDTDHVDDYQVGFNTCTATAALDREQALYVQRDEQARKAGRNPDRARQWATWLPSEGAPWT